MTSLTHWPRKPRKNFEKFCTCEVVPYKSLFSNRTTQNPAGVENFCVIERRQGGSISPENASPARTDGKEVAEGASIGGKAAIALDQRVEESRRRPFHLKTGTREMPREFPSHSFVPL
jgi:hypothetical protein